MDFTPLIGLVGIILFIALAVGARLGTDWLYRLVARLSNKRWLTWVAHWALTGMIAFIVAGFVYIYTMLLHDPTTWRVSVLIGSACAMTLYTAREVEQLYYAREWGDRADHVMDTVGPWCMGLSLVSLVW